MEEKEEEKKSLRFGSKRKQKERERQTEERDKQWEEPYRGDIIEPNLLQKKKLFFAFVFSNFIIMLRKKQDENGTSWLRKN